MSEILRLYPPPTEPVTAIYEDLEFPVQSRRGDLSKPYVYINMVSSLDGKVAEGGKSGGIGGETDRETMRVLRSKADAVIVGAGALRAEKMSLTSEGRRSPEPLAVIVSGSGTLPLEENLLGAERDRTIIVAPESISRERRNTLSRHAHVLVSPTGASGRPDLSKTIRLLKHSFRVHTLLVEGGPSLNHSLISNELADEFFLTLSPKLIGGDPGDTLTPIQGPHFPHPSPQAELLSVHLAGSSRETELFLRYSLNPSISFR